MDLKINKKEQKTLYKAITEYEENHYETEDDKWQDIVNNLSIKLRGL